MNHLPEQLLELALKSGAEKAEVYQEKSLSRPVFFEANRLKQLESSESEGTALRLWKNGRPGLAVAYGDIAPQALVDKAIALSDLNEPETIDLISNHSEDYPDLGSDLSVEKLLEMGKESISLIRQKFPEVLCSASWECDQETIRLINTNGLDLSYQDTTLSFYIGVEWVRGDDFLNVGDGQVKRGSLEPKLVIEKICQRLEWAKENSQVSAGKFPVLFTDKAADMLWDTICAALNAKRVLEKSSPWSEKLQQQVISPALNIQQKPDFGPYSCPFDDEGMPTQHLILVDHGILQQFYSDRTTAKSLNQSPTGNGFKPGLGSYPNPGLVNLIIAPGAGNLLDLIAQIDQGLIIDQMLGGTAGISGDFSVNIDLGYWVEKGQIMGRVKDTMVSGNVYNALKQIIALGSDNDWNGTVFTPSVIVDGLSITGKK